MPARDGLEDLYLFASFAIFHEVADEDDAVVAAVRTKALKAGVVNVEGVVVVVYSGGVHSGFSFSVGRVPGCFRTCGALLYPTPSV